MKGIRSLSKYYFSHADVSVVPPFVEETSFALCVLLLHVCQQSVECIM